MDNILKYLNHDQASAYLKHQIMFGQLMGMSKTHEWLRKTFGNVHKITVEFRKEYYIPAQKDKQNAQEAAQAAYDILWKHSKKAAITRFNNHFTSHI